MNLLKKIMLIEDDHITNYLNERILKDYFKIDDILTFNSGDDAILYIMENKECVNDLGLILLDIHMSRLNGFEFLTIFSGLHDTHVDTKHIPVIMLSSSIMAEDREKSLQFNNVKSFFTKPLTLENLALFFNEFCLVTPRDLEINKIKSSQ